MQKKLENDKSSPNETGADKKNTLNHTEERKVTPFNEVWNKNTLDDSELLSDYIGEEIVIKETATLDGDYGEYKILLTEVKGKNIKLRTSSKVVMEQLAAVAEDLPVRATPTTKQAKDGSTYHQLV